MYSPHPRHKRYNKERKPHVPSPSEKFVLAYSIYLPSLAYYYDPTGAKDLTKILPTFRPWQDSNRERARRLTPTRAITPLTCDV
jgi:hypothetical protein